MNDIASARQNLLSLQSTDFIDYSATNKVIANLASASTRAAYAACSPHICTNDVS
jgi:hypothetical protein